MAAVLPDAVYLVLRASLGRRARDGQHLRHRTRAVVLSVNACMTSLWIMDEPRPTHYRRLLL